MQYVVMALAAVGRFIISFKGTSIAFFSYVSANFLSFFFAFQVLAWIVSGIFTLLLAFYGTEMVSAIFDMTGIKSYTNGLFNQIQDFGTELDGANIIVNAFGSTIHQALTYFHFFDFLNLIISLSYGIFSLKINIMIWRATRFTSAKAGIMGRGMGQYPIAPGG